MMKLKRSTQRLALLAVLVPVSWLTVTDAGAYERYKNSSGSGNCSTCHGDFTDPASLSGSRSGR
jgi:cytochrome c553